MVKTGKIERRKISVLCSVSFGNYNGINELPDEVLGLFTSLLDNPNKKLEFASEIIFNGLSGRINFNQEFNIDAYEATIRKNQNLGKENKRKKECYIDMTDSADDWEEVSGRGGIKLAQVNSRAVDKIQDAYEHLLLDDELKYAVDTIKAINEDLMVEESIDLIYALKQSVRGIPDAVKSVKEICENNSLVAELVKTVLNSGYEVGQIFA